MGMLIYLPYRGTSRQILEYTIYYLSIQQNVRQQIFRYNQFSNKEFRQNKFIHINKYTWISIKLSYKTPDIWPNTIMPKLNTCKQHIRQITSSNNLTLVLI